MTVTAIGANAFCPAVYPHLYPANVTSVTLPSTVRIIKSGAFQSVPLQKIELPASVVTVEEYAFDACPNLQTVKIKGSVALGKCAFRDCSALQTVEIRGTSAIGEKAFQNCSALHTIDIRSASSFGKDAFLDCSSLFHAKIHPNSTSPEPAFNGCTALTKLNGIDAFSYQTGLDGNLYPKLDYDSDVRSVIRNLFTKCSHVGFVDNFCTALCNYIVGRETDNWMSDALKARQLHDWLLRHVQYEDEQNGETLLDPDNQLCSSVFLSYELNTRAYEVGESVCRGYAKAYKMLLSAAGIESYVVTAARIGGGLNHDWNLIRIGDQYYECDTTWDDNHNYWGQYGTSYTHFLKSDAEMSALHHHNYNSTHIYNCASEHELLSINYGTGTSGLAQCTSSYTDANHDGILDYDYDLNGKTGNADYWLDMLAHQQLCGQQQWNYGYSTSINGKLPEILYRLHLLHCGFWG